MPIRKSCFIFYKRLPNILVFHSLLFNDLWQLKKRDEIVALKMAGMKNCKVDKIVECLQ